MKGNVRIAGLAALLSAGILFIAPQDAAAGVLPQGFSVSGSGEKSFDLSGMTASEAEAELETYVNSLAGQQVSIAIDGNSLAWRNTLAATFWSGLSM